MADFESAYLNRAILAARLLRHLPFIRLVGLNGSLVLKTATEVSDIDLFIVSRYGRIYTVRLFSNLLLVLTSLRRQGDRVAGRICLNRYQTTRSLGVLPENAYHARYFAPLVPLVAARGVYEGYQAANRWMGRFGQRVKPGLKLSPPIEPSALAFLIERLLSGRGGDPIEAIVRSLQVRRISLDPRTRAAPPGRVRFSDLELCFHPLKEKNS